MRDKEIKIIIYIFNNMINTSAFKFTKAKTSYLLILTRAVKITAMYKDKES